MLRRKSYNINTVGMNDQDIWLTIRNVLGPVPDMSNQLFIDLRDRDFADYQHYIATYGGTATFKQWFMWKLTTGSSIYGSLGRTLKNTHEGHCYAPCPYSVSCDEARTRIMLKLSDTDPLPIQVSHTIGSTDYFLKSSNRGSIWGYECTCPNCSFLLATGKKYFFV